MRTAHILALSLLPACGPVTPPLESATTTTATSEPGSTTAPVPTTTSPESTTTSSDATSTTTATTDTTTQDFIIKPDGHTGSGTCAVFAQDCPMGQKCAAWAQDGGGAWNATKCVDITGDGAPGEPCTAEGGGLSGIDDCALGSMCWDIDSKTQQGTCVGLCTGTPAEPMCPPMFKCYISGDGTLNLCLSHCDPLIQDCPGTDLCIPSADEFTCVSDDSGDAGQTNDPCEFYNSCDKGLICLNPASASSACDPKATGCCQPFCEFPGAPCPNPDQQCVQWYDPMMPIPPGNEDIGVCAIPL